MEILACPLTPEADYGLPYCWIAPLTSQAQALLLAMIWGYIESRAPGCQLTPICSPSLKTRTKAMGTILVVHLLWATILPRESQTLCFQIARSPENISQNLQKL